MQRVHRIAIRFGALAALSLTISACSSAPSSSGLLPTPDAILKRPDWATFSGAKSEFALRPVTTEDLVSAEPDRGPAFER